MSLEKEGFHKLVKNVDACQPFSHFRASLFNFGKKVDSFDFVCVALLWVL